MWLSKMSIDPIGAAVKLDRPGLSTDASHIASDQSSALADLTAAIERVEALLASVGPEPEGADAIERIADIAFVLHEREVEASLCDALDAAVRELSNADAAKQANVQHVRQAAELLREQSVRVSDMIALLQAPRTSGANETVADDVTREQDGLPLALPPAGANALDADIPPEGLFTAETLENDQFARAVADLAASLPALTAPVKAAVVAPHEAAALAKNEVTLATGPEQAAIETQDEPTDRTASPDELATELPVVSSQLEEAAADTSVKTQHDCAELPQHGPALEQQAPAIQDAPISQQAPAQEFSVAEAIEEPVAREDESSAPHPAAEASKHEAVSDAEPQPRVSEQSPVLLPELALVDPQDDPGDLFEPLTNAAPSIAAVTLTNTRPTSEIPARAAAIRARSPAAPADPLAAMRTFGAEELLALFT